MVIFITSLICKESLVLLQVCPHEAIRGGSGSRSLCVCVCVCVCVSEAFMSLCLHSLVHYSALASSPSFLVVLLVAGGAG